jgi:hypothetical protein
MTNLNSQFPQTKGVKMTTAKEVDYFFSARMEAKETFGHTLSTSGIFSIKGNIKDNLPEMLKYIGSTFSPPVTNEDFVIISLNRI